MTTTTDDAETSAGFERVDRALDESGPTAAVDALVALLSDRNEYRALLDALLLKARIELGLPALAPNSLAEIPEPARTQYEERYVEAIRHVGRRLLDAGEIGAAWSYFRAIGEKEAVAQAIEAFEPPNDGEEDRIGPIIEVAFNQGAHPRKGFDLILDHYGTCSAITAFESLPPEESIRVHAAGRLVRRLHDDIVANLRGEIGRRGQPLPPEGTPILGLLEGRDWLFVDDAYHIDVSHLSSTVRLAPLLSDPEGLALAVDLTEYGRRLSDRHRYEGDPPFEDHYEDHRAYLNALLGRDVDAAVERFRGKLDPPDPDGRDEAIPAQVLVRLLSRLGRDEEAVEVAATHLAHIPDAMLGCPGVAELCGKLGRLDRLAEVARDRGDLVKYTSARLALGSGQPR